MLGPECEPGDGRALRSTTLIPTATVARAATDGVGGGEYSRPAGPAQAPGPREFRRPSAFDGTEALIYNPFLMRVERARLYDKRVVQRNIRAERVTKDEYKAWLGDLPDVSDKIKARDEGGDDDGFDPAAKKPEAPPATAPTEVAAAEAAPAQAAPVQAAPVQAAPDEVAPEIPAATSPAPVPPPTSGEAG